LGNAGQTSGKFWLDFLEPLALAGPVAAVLMHRLGTVRGHAAGFEVARELGAVGRASLA
jgi:hypothetical protein